MKSFKTQNQFFHTSYKGFLCTVCDFTQQNFINEQYSTITYADSFCRKIVQNNLAPNLYLKNHFKKLGNLMAKFMTSCDFEGKFFPLRKIPKEVVYSITEHEEEKMHKLVECKKYRNTAYWLIYCKDFCSHFKMTKISNYYS